MTREVQDLRRLTYTASSSFDPWQMPDGRILFSSWHGGRVYLFGINLDGTDYAGPATQVSVTFAGNGVVNISISAGGVPLTVAPVFQAAVLSGVLPLPFQMTFEVLL